ncbi:MAG TPA: deoxyhypusine synthase family protein [archaeon]|nr:deoxyhypusine synthase family protein [archaeon]
MQDPISHSRWMGGRRAQVPLRITKEFVDATTYHIKKIDSGLGYQASRKPAAAKRWVKGIQEGEYVWLGVAGAATPAGMGGLFADLISLGLVDAIVTTGANAYHDLHYACGLPVRHGHHQVDDDDLRRDETTRIYDRFIHNRYTLKAQDMINQDFARRVLPRMKPPFSTAQFLYEFGKEMLNDDSGIVIDKKGSFIVRAAEHGVPVFLDSGANHSLGMDLSLLALEGMYADTSPTQDVLQAAALSVYTQPQLNVFLGEGGPRNFTQTTAPTAAEIFALQFDGSAGCIRFTTADERTGGLSGSGQSEAVSWGKYLDADPRREIEVWGEYTLTAPDVMGFVAGKAQRKPSRLMDRLDEITKGFYAQIKAHEPERIASQKHLKEILLQVIAAEKKAREKAGYKFE